MLKAEVRVSPLISVYFFVSSQYAKAPTQNLAHIVRWRKVPWKTSIFFQVTLTETFILHPRKYLPAPNQYPSKEIQNKNKLRPHHTVKRRILRPGKAEFWSSIFPACYFQIWKYRLVVWSVLTFPNVLSSSLLLEVNMLLDHVHRKWITEYKVWVDVADCVAISWIFVLKLASAGQRSFVATNRRSHHQFRQNVFSSFWGNFILFLRNGRSLSKLLLWIALRKTK